MKSNLEQQIPKFIPEAVKIFAGDGVSNLVGLFDGVRRDARKILLLIPGAAARRVPQLRHDLK